MQHLAKCRARSAARRALRRVAPWLAGLGLAGAAQAVLIDVSEIVSGGGLSVAMPPDSVLGSPVSCTSACKHAQVASAGIDGSYTAVPGNEFATTWGPAFLASRPTLNGFSRSLTIVGATDTVSSGGSVGVAQRAAVDFDWTSAYDPRRLAVQTWRVGSGIATLSYAVQVNTPASGARRTYLSFAVPQAVNAYAFRDGSATDYRPNRVNARAAAEVFVDGLPVWAGEIDRVFPKRLQDWPPYFDTNWGAALDGSRVDLHLGELPAGSTRHIAVVFRVELRADGECSVDTTTSPKLQTCHAHLQTLSIPATRIDPVFAGYRPDIQVYTR